jgi:RND family efflux transporter MFP subunit
MIRILLAFLISLTLHAGEVYATFTIHPLKSADLAFASSGIVKDVYVDVTSKVKKGDVLARLKNDDLKAMLEIAKTSLKYAKLDFDRQKKIKHLIDSGKFDSYAYKYESAKAELSYREALYNLSILKAPFDGVITMKDVESGDVVSGQMIRTLFNLQDQKRQKVILEFDQIYWKSVHVGDEFHFSVDGDTNIHKTKIKKISPIADEKSRKIRAEAVVDGFKVGLFGDGNIITK